MGQVTPNIGIYIPAAGEKNYAQSFAAGMINIDLHDHSGGPNKGVPIGNSGLGDFSVTFDKLNSNVVDPTTGIGTQGAPFQNRLELLGFIKNLYQLSIVPGIGIVVMNGATPLVRSIAVGSGLSVSNANGVSGNPTISLTGGGVQTIQGTANQIAVSNMSGTWTISLAPIVINPTQPAFLATVTLPQDNVTGDGTDYQVLFGNEVFDQGNNYSTSTSEFTAPVSGVYDLGVNLELGDISSNLSTEIAFYVNGSLAYTVFYGRVNGLAVGANTILSGRQLAKLNANDVVTVHLIVNSGTGKTTDIDSGNFTAVLVC